MNSDIDDVGEGRGSRFSLGRALILAGQISFSVLLVSFSPPGVGVLLSVLTGLTLLLACNEESHFQRERKGKLSAVVPQATRRTALWFFPTS